MSDTIDDGVVKSFRFSKVSDTQIQNSVDAGYLESEADFAQNAYQILFKVMALVEEDKEVIDFNSITVTIGIDVPPLQRPGLLQ